MGINGTLCRTPPNAEDFEQGAHIRALLLPAIAQTALTLTALQSEDLEGTAKMKVAAQIRGLGVKTKPWSNWSFVCRLKAGSVPSFGPSRRKYWSSPLALTRISPSIWPTPSYPAVSCRACSRGRFFGRFAKAYLSEPLGRSTSRCVPLPVLPSTGSGKPAPHKSSHAPQAAEIGSAMLPIGRTDGKLSM